MGEAKLINRCLNKDKKAWGIFVQKYSRLVYWAIRKRLTAGGFRQEEADVEDIFQEVFLLVLGKDKLRQVNDFKFIPGWLAMIASNKTVDFMRGKFHLEQDWVFDAMREKDNVFKDNLQRRDMFAVTKEVIGALPDKERIVISLNLLEERTHKEIAEITGMPVNTVSTIISRTKEKLRKELRKREIDENF